MLAIGSASHAHGSLMPALLWIVLGDSKLAAADGYNIAHERFAAIGDGRGITFFPSVQQLENSLVARPSLHAPDAHEIGERRTGFPRIHFLYGAPKPLGKIGARGHPLPEWDHNFIEQRFGLRCVPLRLLLDLYHHAAVATKALESWGWAGFLDG